MEEIDLKELFEYYLKNAILIILTTILALLIGYFYIIDIQVPKYYGTTTIVLFENKENSTLTQNDLTVNEKLVSTYSEIIKSRRVLQPVIEELGLNTEVDILKKQITVTSVSNTSIIELKVSDESKRNAAIIANKIAEIFKEEITKIYNLENISIIDEAIAEDEPYNVNILKQMVISGLVGLFLSSGIVFVMFYFDNTIKNKKEIESKLNLPVLGEIPLSRKMLNKKQRRGDK